MLFSGASRRVDGGVKRKNIAEMDHIPEMDHPGGADKEGKRKGKTRKKVHMAAPCAGLRWVISAYVSVKRINF